MGIWDKIKGEFIDIVEWLDPTNDTMVYRFERYNNEIKNGAQLIVRESQVAVFIDQGQIADVFQPGRYELTTSNLPILSTIKGWKYGFDSPFKCEVYYVNTKNFTDQKWGTRNPIILNDDRFGMLEIRSFGTFAIRVKDAGLFIKEIVGTDGSFTTAEVAEQLRSIVVTRFTDAIAESKIPVELMAGNQNELSDIALAQIQPEFLAYGLDLTKFLIENVSMPEEIKKEIFELSRLGKINLDQLAKIKAAKAIEKAAENPSGMAGAGVGMGMGYVVANQMGQLFNQPSNAPGTPPPLPNSNFFLGINGKQEGPFDLATLQQMILKGAWNADTMVWTQGMPAWSKASDVEALKPLLGAVPPPLPPQ
jgi:membrane protease subunit (stomatin/prohibitin family)